MSNNKFHLSSVPAFVYLALFLSVVLSACSSGSNDKEEDAAYVTFSIPKPGGSGQITAQQLENVTSIIITVADDKGDSVSGDIWESGGNLTLKVKPHALLTISGVAYEGSVATYSGEAAAGPLRPGTVESISLTLTPILQPAKPDPVVTPGNGASDIAIDTSFVVDISALGEEVGLLSGASLTLSDGNSPAINTTYLEPEEGFVLNFSLPDGALLNPGTLYSTSLQVNYTDLNGAIQSYDYSWSFTTVEVLSDPVVIPANGAVDVVADTGFAADVSSALGSDITALQTVSLTLTDGISVITTSYTPPENGFDLNFALVGAMLNANTPYTANLQIGYTDVSGGANTYDYSWTFTTGGALPAPLVAPTVDAAGVLIDSAFTADFSSLSANIASFDNATLTLIGGLFPASTQVQLPTSGSVIDFSQLQNDLLRPGTTYTADLSLQYTGIDSVTHTYFYSWSFTTSDAINLAVITDPDLYACVESYVTINEMLLVSQVTDLNCGNDGIQDITGIQQFINLATLDLSDNNISDITAVRELTALISLDFGWCGECSYINDISDLTPLSGLINLQQLILDTNLITDASPLAGLTNLQYLDLSSNQLENLDWAQNLTQLTSLYVSSNSNLTDISGLQNLTQLTILSASYGAINDASVLNSLSGLTTAYLSNNDIDTVNLSGLPNLGTLNLSLNQITDVTISDMPQLQTLRLNSNKISSISLTGTLDSLQSLYLRYSHVNDIGFLANLTTLTYLDLTGNNIGDLTVFANNANLATTLRTLRLDYNNISDVAPLSGFTGLSYLYLSGNNIASGVDALTGLTSAFGINLHSNPRMSCDMIQVLDAALDISNGPTLGPVRWNTCFTDGPVANLSFGTNTQLQTCINTQYSTANVSEVTTLDCSNSGITNLTGIDQLPLLENLNLSNNPIVDFTGLSNVRNLSVLNLGNAQVGDLSFLPTLKNLNNLVLDSNPFTNLFTHLGGLTNLVNLSLANNQISSGLMDLTTLVNAQTIDLSCSPAALETQLTELDNAIDQGNGSDTGIVIWPCAQPGLILP